MEIENIKTGMDNAINATIQAVKRTNNTSIKNLTVNVISGCDGSIETLKINNMHQVWKFVRGHYGDKKNLGDKITVYQDDVLLHDIYAEIKSSGKLWTMDKTHFGTMTKKAKVENAKA